VKKSRSESTKQRAICCWCGKLVPVRKLPGSCLLWFEKHKIRKAFCLGSGSNVEKVTETTWTGPPPILEAARAKSAETNGGPSQ
jgi:hypothetical protein